MGVSQQPSQFVQGSKPNSSSARFKSQGQAGEDVVDFHRVQRLGARNQSQLEDQVIAQTMIGAAANGSNSLEAASNANSLSMTNQ